MPVNPPPGVKVMVEVFPVVAPGLSVTAVPLIVKLEVVIVTVNVFDVLAENAANP